MRGFNDPLKQKEIVKRIYKLKVDVVFLLETRVKYSKMGSIVERWFKGWSYLHNYDHAVNGRIWVLWKSSVDIRVLDMNDQCITMTLVKLGMGLVVSVVYGSNLGSERRRLWEFLRQVYGGMDACPWIVAGDFNVVASIEESSEHLLAEINSVRSDSECCVLRTPPKLFI
ncbi:MAG: hypothetical protein Q8807_03105 ['Waltheria sp.' little leaf phytoplasma]|nr:hypothetical protein ['Waltheria sp.' little leaf phytoplasma]